MRRQRNMAQMEEQIKTAEKELNEVEISNLSDAKFKILVIALAGEAQWIEHQPVNQRVTGLISSQGTCLGCGARSPVVGT